MKPCTPCNQVKPLEQFGKAKMCADGHRSYYKTCHKTIKDSWRARNKDHHNEKCRAWNRANPEKRAEIVRVDREKRTKSGKCAIMGHDGSRTGKCYFCGQEL